MAKVFIEETSLTAIGDAIRAKTGDSALMSPAEMVTAIEGITTGGGGGECNLPHIPEEALTITGGCGSKFANNGWNWFIEAVGDKIITKDIQETNSMFNGSNQLTSIPFDINIDNSTYRTMANMFGSCYALEEIGDINNAYPSSMDGLFNSCRRLKYLPTFNNLNMDRIYTYSSGTTRSMFQGCYSLRSIPEDFLKQLKTPKATSYLYTVFYGGFQNCYALDEIRGLNPETGAIASSNTFASSFNYCTRVKDVLFALQEDGTPYSVNWKSQTIDLASYIGYVTNILDVTNHNSGITTATRVTDDATYEALKNDPDWWSTDIAYSRYNHDSAVNTINSLPITTNTGCTIKFKGAAGAKTDGGAISNLTEEEIAVATAKGWTVTLT